MPAGIALGGVVLSMLRGAGVASNCTEVTDVLSVLARSVRHAYLCQSGRVWLGLTPSRSSRGS
jgi:hypothetical protein